MASIKNYGDRFRKELYGQLLHVAKRKTSEADTLLDDGGRKVASAGEDFGENVLIVNPEEHA